MPGGYRGTTGRGVTTPGPHVLLEEVDQPLVGWPKPPLRAHAAGVEGKGKKQKVERVSKWRGGILMREEWESYLE